MKKIGFTTAVLGVLFLGSLADAHASLPAEKARFELKNKEEVLKQELETGIAKPVLIAQKDRVLLARDAEDVQSLKVDIYYKGMDLVHSEQISKEGQLLRTYNFSESQVGWYLFQISYDDQRFKEYVFVY